MPREGKDEALGNGLRARVRARVCVRDGRGDGKERETVLTALTAVSQQQAHAP